MSFIPKNIKFNPKQYISQADVNRPLGEKYRPAALSSIPEDLYQSIAASPLPTGNGRLASPLKAQGETLSFDLGHTDLFPFSGASTAVSRDKTANYACGVGLIDIDFGDEIFGCGATAFMHCYNGICGYKSELCDITIGADMSEDLLYIRINDKRENPKPLTIHLRSARPPVVKAGKHTALSNLEVINNCAVLVQEFSEETGYGNSAREYFTRSALSVCAVPLNTEDLSIAFSCPTPQELTITSSQKKPHNSKGFEYELFISAAVDFSRNGNAAERAVEICNTACNKSAFNTLYSYAVAEKTASWFEEYWSRSFVSLGKENYLKASEIYFIKLLYLFALSKRGKYPPLHQANPLYGTNSYHLWGSRLWWYNQSRYEYGMLNVNHPELNYPLLGMVTRNIPAYSDMARQAWGAQGIFISETTSHDGPERVPDKIADEMQPLFTEGKIPSDSYIAYGRERDHYLSMWNSCEGNTPEGSYTMRIAYGAADIADLFRLHYLYSGDEAYLREYAYPMLRDAAEFYRTSKILRKEADGKYHIFPTNYAETFWGAKDVIDDVSMIHSLLPTAAAYAEKLGTDADKIPLWREIAENMCDIPSSDMSDCISHRSKDGKRAFAMCRKPCFVPGSRGEEYPGTACDEQIRPIMNYDYVTLESKNDELKKLCMNTLDGHLVLRQIENGENVEMDDCLRFTVDCARLGRADLADRHIRYQAGRIFEGAGKELENNDISTEALERIRAGGVFDLQTWCLPEGINECLLGCCAENGGSESSVIYIAPAWNMQRDASFLLAARNGFEVACEIADGKVKHVEIFSKLGKFCRIRNTFAEKGNIQIICGEEKITVSADDYIEFATAENRSYIIL